MTLQKSLGDIDTTNVSTVRLQTTRHQWSRNSQVSDYTVSSQGFRTSGDQDEEREISTQQSVGSRVVRCLSSPHPPHINIPR